MSSYDAWVAARNIEDVQDELPDAVECNESAAEAWADGNVRGDEFRCADCSKWNPLSEAQPSGMGPYSLPVCQRCCDAAEAGHV